MYSIADLERISGIKAHTIRIWEKRYKLFAPSRTKGNHRLYSDDDFMRLLNVSRFVKEGYRISTVAGWSEAEIANRLGEYEKQTDANGGIDNYFIEELISAAISFDERRFYRAMKRVEADFDFLTIWIELFLPVLQRVGNLWLAKKFTPSQEHFISALIRRKMSIAIDKQTAPPRNSPTILLFMPPNEYHELGLIMCNYVIRNQGLNTVFLGQDVPLINIRQFVSAHRPMALLTFAQHSRFSKRFRTFVETDEVFKQVKLLISGVLHREDYLLTRELDYVERFSSIEELDAYLVDGIRQQRPAAS